ncbi:TonB-dependent receptor [Parabacteroides sp.]
MKKQKFNELSGKVWRIPLFIGIFCLLTSVSGVVSASAQVRSISIRLDNVSLSDAIDQIGKASGYSFFYDENKIDLSHQVSLKAKNQTINKVLDNILKSTGLTYEISNNQIVLLPAERRSGNTKAEPIVAGVQQQAGIIKGVVVDNLGEPVIGANVIEKGTTNGIITDVNGEFTLNVSANATLEISFIGYVTQTVPVKGNSINVVLREDSQALEEVVITGFGLAQKKATLTGAISSVGSDDLARSISSTASGALAGKIAGVNFRQTDGRPGATTQLQIRNMGTPLYVIDGTITDEAQFNNIDFNDIETISILKDASAAIYGVRAANGVVVVTTKKGKRNTKNTVGVNMYYGWQNPTKFAKPADAMSYITNYIQSQTVQGVPYTYSKEDYGKWQQGTEKGYQPFDWYDYIWNTAPQYYVNANVSGGSDKVNYYFSVGHLNQDAMIVNYGGFERTNVQMNVESQINERFKIGASMNGRIETRKNPGVPGGDDYWAPIFATYRNLPTKRPFANDNPNYPQMTSTDKSTNFAILNYERSGKYQEDWRVIQMNANAEYEIFDGLKAKALVGYYYANQNLNNQEYTYKLYKYDEATDTYPEDTPNCNSNPWRERRMGYNQELTANVQLSYNKKIEEHTIAAIAGFESSKRVTPSTWVHSMPTANSLHLIDYETMDTYDDRGDETQARLGWLGRINYDFSNKYLLEVSARYDGSWKFPPNHRWGFFPSASVGWRVSEEAFWKNSNLSNIFDDLKIRGSYGLVGDDDLGKDPDNDNKLYYNPFDYLGGYNYKNGGSVIDGAYTTGSVPRGLPVTTLSWIKAKILDIGFDASFMNSRLTGSVDYFRRLRTGLPAARYDILLPSEVGFKLPKENLESDVHTGMDLSLRWNDQVNDFAYSVGANMTYSRKYLWDRYKPRYSNSWDEYRNGKVHRFDQISWGYKSDGQFNSWEEIASWPINNDGHGNTTLRPGDIKYKDMNGDGIINDMDKRPVGYITGDSFNPSLSFGFNFSASWKGFDVSLDFTGSAFSSYFPNFENKLPFHDGGNSPQYMMDDMWHLSDIWDANSALIPGKYPMMLIGNSSHSNYWDSDFWIQKVRYVKLKNLEIGYNLPRVWLEKAWMQQCRIYVAAQNLFTISSVNGVDPEVIKDSGLVTPTTRIINIGLNVKF